MRTERWQRTWLLVAAVCAAGFGLLALVVNGQGSVWFDADVIAIVKGLGIPPDVWRAFTDLGGRFLTVMGIGLVLWLVWQRRIQLAVIVGLALLAGTFATELVKLAIERPRPTGEPLAPWSGYSFPSGHTLNSTVTYGLVALVAWRTTMPPVARQMVVAALAVLVAMIGLSRIALGVHYPSDVMAGWLGGFAIVAVVAAVPAVVFFGQWVRTRPAPAPRPLATPAPLSTPDPESASADE